MPVRRSNSAPAFSMARSVRMAERPSETSTSSWFGVHAVAPRKRATRARESTVVGTFFPAAAARTSDGVAAP